MLAKGVVVDGELCGAASVIRPDDAIVELGKEARRCRSDLLVDPPQLPAILLPSHVDGLSNEALV